MLLWMVAVSLLAFDFPTVAPPDATLDSGWRPLLVKGRQVGTVRGTEVVIPASDGGFAG